MSYETGGFLPKDNVPYTTRKSNRGTPWPRNALTPEVVFRCAQQLHNNPHWFGEDVYAEPPFCVLIGRKFTKDEWDWVLQVRRRFQVSGMPPVFDPTWCESIFTPRPKAEKSFEISLDQLIKEKAKQYEELDLDTGILDEIIKTEKVVFENKKEKKPKPFIISAREYRWTQLRKWTFRLSLALALILIALRFLA